MTYGRLTLHCLAFGTISTQEIHDGLDFAVNDDDDSDLGFFSVKFSMDGQELVAASKDNSIYVYDLEANKLSLRIPAHTVCSGYKTLLEVLLRSKDVNRKHIGY